MPNSQVLSLVVAGHRPDRLPQGEAREGLVNDLENLLTLLSLTAKSENAVLRVLTGTSEGIDDEAARISKNLEISLHLLSSGNPETLSGSRMYAERAVWLGANDLAAPSGNAVAIRDEVALAFGDLLLVVWDGDTPQGLSGGTVRLALAAALAMKPVVWLDTDGTVRLLERTRLNGQTLHKLSGPNPEIAWLRDCFSGPLQGELLQVGIAANLRLTLDPSSAAGDREKHRLADYQVNLATPNKAVWAGQLHEALIALLCGNWARLRRQFSPSVPHAYFGEKETEKKLGRLLLPTTILDSRFEYFDVQATMAAGWHRDVNWLIHFSSSLAVFAAVAGAIGLWVGGHSILWPVAELVVVSAVIGGVLLAKSRRWHERWVGYRFVAEQLRYMRICLPILGVPAPFKAPAWRVIEDESGSATLRLASPETWILQRTLAQQGVPVGIDGKHLTGFSSSSSEEIAGYVHSVVKDQEDYHRRNHHKLHVAHMRLHMISSGLFVATALAVLAHFALHADWLLIGTAFLPALGGAIHGVSSKLEIARIAGQSAATEHRLSHLAKAIRSMGGHGGLETWLGLRQLVLEAARIMSDENAQWQQLIEHQETGFPA